MDIEEAHGIFLSSDPVEDPFLAAPDLEFVMWDEEIDYDWRMVVLPIEALGCDLSLDPTPGHALDEERERFDRIRSWMKDKGMEAALRESPPIAVMTDEAGLEIVDGRHRLALAREAGFERVRVLLGTAPGWSPATGIRMTFGC